ncbi:MAG TPA: hypothetical protein VG168_18000 [Bryobacteraceae bacterium]|jgi:hypothetical protein|nr:hypothetical protein [Bryobacteraceae bacterium]
MKESPREHFRWAAHTGGLATVKPKDYEAAEEAEAPTPYALWKQLQVSGNPLRPGDVLETLADDGAPGPLQITKYIGFEAAQWYVPEAKPATVPAIVEAENNGASSECGSPR